jgi:ABC-type transporter Mla subunit MlaD
MKPTASAYSSEFRTPSLLFIGSGLLVLGLFLVAIGRQQSWGEARFPVYFRAPSALGLKRGMDVHLSGIRVGQVQQIKLQPDASVEVELRIGEPYRRYLGPRSTVSTGSVTLLGDAFVVLKPDPAPGGQTSSRPLPQRLPFEAAISLQSFLNDLQGTRQELNRTLLGTTQLAQKDVPNTLQSLRSNLSQAGQMSKQVGQEVRSTGPVLRSTLGNIEQTSTAVRHTAGSTTNAANAAQQTFNELRPDLLNTIHELDSTARNLNQLLIQLQGSWLFLGDGLRKPPLPEKKP